MLFWLFLFVRCEIVAKQLIFFCLFCLVVEKLVLGWLWLWSWVWMWVVVVVWVNWVNGAIVIIVVVLVVVVMIVLVVGVVLLAVWVQLLGVAGVGTMLDSVLLVVGKVVAAAFHGKIVGSSIRAAALGGKVDDDIIAWDL